MNTKEGLTTFISEQIHRNKNFGAKIINKAGQALAKPLYSISI
jgi:hypothetical protein